MKKIQIMAAVLLILFVLSACSSRSENPAQAASVSPEPTGSSQAEPQPDDPPEEELSELPAVVGSYTFEVRGVEPQNYPALEIYADGTFRFTANLLNYLGHFEGGCKVDNMQVTLTVDTVDFEGFTADQVGEIYFEVATGNDLIYMGNDSEEQAIGVTNPYDRFKRQKMNAGKEPETSSAEESRVSIKLVSNTSYGEKELSEQAAVGPILSMLETLSPLSDTDDLIEKREGSPSINLTIIRDGSSEQWIIFPGTPESIGEEVTVLFGENGQSSTDIGLFEMLNGILVS